MNPEDNAPRQLRLPISDWRSQRKSGARIIAASVFVAALLWLGIRYFAPPLSNMDSLADRLLFAFKCWCFAVLFCFATGIDAVAHERLQSPAFDPLLGYETKRMRINLRYLQNTLEQLIVFTAGLFGLATYSNGGDAMRAVEATAVVWILFRFAFWIGYHRSAAMRSMGAAGVGLSLIVLIYVVARMSFGLGGVIGVAVSLGTFSIIEAILFWTTRFRETPQDRSNATTD
ncbi:MAG TPA: MAPEG family protein [Beijerinckiaceae bacterium]|nr:MAPEG family protein [Beijerinckiaceae bacterium]